jgi:FkbM family methyltransferase
MRLYYAQNKEDLLIKAFFPDVKKGFYIDVGANDPVIDSVTKLLYDAGWSGINIEPIPRHAQALRQQRKRDITLNIGLSDKAGGLTLREYVNGDGLSTFDASMIKQYEGGEHAFPTKKFKEYSVQVKTLNDVITENKVEHIHFIKIDVEGFEYKVISGYGWSKVRPELICIESNHVRKDWRPLITKKGYEEVFFDGVNSYYLAKESMFREKYFNYPNAVLAGNPVYYPAVDEAGDFVREAVTTSFRDQMQALSQKIGDQENQIAVLHMQQRNVRFLAKRLSEELQLRLNKRAKGNVKRVGLAYLHDESIKRKLEKPGTDRQELLGFIHERDRVNIRQKRASMSEKIKPALWAMIAWLFMAGTKVVKRIAKRTAYGR